MIWITPFPVCWTSKCILRIETNMHHFIFTSSSLHSCRENKNRIVNMRNLTKLFEWNSFISLSNPSDPSHPFLQFPTHWLVGTSRPQWNSACLHWLCVHTGKRWLPWFASIHPWRWTRPVSNHTIGRDLDHMIGWSAWTLHFNRSSDGIRLVRSARHFTNSVNTICPSLFLSNMEKIRSKKNPSFIPTSCLNSLFVRTSPTSVLFIDYSVIHSAWANRLECVI